MRTEELSTDGERSWLTSALRGRELLMLWMEAQMTCVRGNRAYGRDTLGCCGKDRNREQMACDWKVGWRVK